MRATWQIKRSRIIAQHCYEIHHIATLQYYITLHYIIQTLQCWSEMHCISLRCIKKCNVLKDFAILFQFMFSIFILYFLFMLF